jgi:hypothetical protein
MEQRTMHGPCEECRQQIADAEREMGAFVAAVAQHSGPVAAIRAAEHWLELAESMNPTLVDGRSICRPSGEPSGDFPDRSNPKLLTLELSTRINPTMKRRLPKVVWPILISTE